MGMKSMGVFNPIPYERQPSMFLFLSELRQHYEKYGGLKNHSNRPKQTAKPNGAYEWYYSFNELKFS